MSDNVGFFIFSLFSKVSVEQGLTALRSRENGIFDQKVQAFFDQVKREGLEEGVLKDFAETSGNSEQVLSEFTVYLLHYLGTIDNIKKAHIFALIFEDLVRGHASVDTAKRLLRAVSLMHYEDVLKLFTLSPTDCLNDQIFVDNCVGAGILTALEKGRFSDDMEDAPIAYRFNYVGKELIAILAKTKGDFLL